MSSDEIRTFIDMIRSARRCVVLTGAGVSTLSGIADFRGPEGIYSRTDIDAERLFSFQAFTEDPTYYYTHTRDFIYGLNSFEPNLVHRELARLELRGIINTIITQNIDMLHQRAGSKRVIELHGSPEWHQCLQCGRRRAFDDIAVVVRGGAVPVCEECGGTVKPGIVFFGEMLDSTVLDDAVGEATMADLFVVLGSSLVVQPAASLPMYAAQRGARLAIVNNMPTPLDSAAQCRLPDLLACFEALAAERL